VTLLVALLPSGAIERLRGVRRAWRARASEESPATTPAR
jgi:hypothetical protein